MEEDQQNARMDVKTTQKSGPAENKTARPRWKNRRRTKPSKTPRWTQKPTRKPSRLKIKPRGTPVKKPPANKTQQNAPMDTKAFLKTVPAENKTAQARKIKSPPAQVSPSRVAHLLMTCLETWKSTYGMEYSYTDPGRTQACNLWFRRPTPYPLGHKVLTVRQLH